MVLADAKNKSRTSRYTTVLQATMTLICYTPPPVLQGLHQSMMKTVYYIQSGLKFSLLLYLMEWQGSVRLLFQPGEEGSGGAKRMVKEGALEDASAIFAIHVNVNLPPGMVSGRPGPFMAAMGVFTVHIQGQGAHAGSPHLSIDPIQGATAVVQSLQQLVSREAIPFDSQVSKIPLLSIPVLVWCHLLLILCGYLQ